MVGCQDLMDSNSNLQILFLAQQSSIRLMQFMHLCFVVDVVVVALLTVVVDDCDGHFPSTVAGLLHSIFFHGHA